VGYIQEKAGLSQSTISNYMSQLKKQELVIAERQGQWTFYRRNEDVIKLFVKSFAEEMGE
jgi:ArsR family transcriptional regulator